MDAPPRMPSDSFRTPNAAEIAGIHPDFGEGVLPSVPDGIR